MKEETLKPLTEYIDDQNYLFQAKGELTTADMLSRITKRNDFGKLSLKLEMFIPCKDGKPLEKPTKEKYGWVESNSFDSEPSGWSIEGGEEAYDDVMIEHQQAEQKVLFKGDWYESGSNDEVKRFLNRDNKHILMYYNIDENRFVFPSHGVGGTKIEHISGLNLELTDYGKEQIL